MTDKKAIFNILFAEVVITNMVRNTIIAYQLQFSEEIILLCRIVSV